MGGKELEIHTPLGLGLDTQGIISFVLSQTIINMIKFLKKITNISHL
jgi:hypothetical protein